MDVEREIAQHHAATLRAIETGRVELAIRRMKAYVKFAEAFLDAATARGIAVSPDASFFDWRTPIQIIRHAYKGILAAVTSGNSELIRAGASIPIQFMNMSVQKKDFLFYRKISAIYPAILSTSYTMDTARGRELIIDRSWGYLRDFAEYFLPKLTAHHDEKMRIQYTSELLWSFGDLMKVAVDHNDTNTFETIGIEMNSLFEYLEIHKLAEDIREELEAVIARERALIWFGLGAWIMRSFILAGTNREPGQPDPKLVDLSQIPTFVDSITRNFSSIRQLAKVYEEAVKRDYGSSRWEGWLMETIREGQVHAIGFGMWLTYFYVVVGLRLSKTGRLTAGDVPESFRELEFSMKNIREKIEVIKAEQQKWEDLIPWLKIKPTVETVDTTHWDYFLSANEAAVKEWTRRREDEIIASPIDPQRIETFKEQCLKGWYASAWLVKVILNMAQQVNATAEAGETYWAVHQRFPKEAFIATNDIEYIGLGFDQGATLGRETNEKLLAQIESSARGKELSGASLSIHEAMELIRAMTSKNSSVIAVIKGNFEIEKQLLGIPGFSACWTQTNPRFTFSEYLGDMNSIQTFFLYDKQVAQITIADLSRIGKLIWYVPQEYNVEGLLIRITEIDKEKANRLVDEQPKFMLNKDGANLTRELAIRNLLLDVDVFVGVKIELEINDYQAIKKIQIS